MGMAEHCGRHGHSAARQTLLSSHGTHQFELLGTLGRLEANHNVADRLAIAAERVFRLLRRQLGHLGGRSRNSVALNLCRTH